MSGICGLKADLSIIIVSYNQFDRTTGPCLESLAIVSDIDLQIIVVDNGSGPETVQQLEMEARRDGRITLLLHGENRGFAVGNNDGVELATADYILLLNSDTVVPPEVPGRMLRTLQQDDAPCLVGPVTNAAGNEQQIFIRDGSGLASVLAQGREWSVHARGSVIKTDQLAFFCVAMARETCRALVGLDPVFGLGFYEDADFCCRASAEGIRLLIQEECFVYHRGSASFSQRPDAVKQLLATNRALFRARHGRRGEGWHVRWKNAAVVKQYLDRGIKSTDSVRYLIENRLAQACRLRPNNPIKKVIYARCLHRLAKSAGRMK